MRGLIVDIIDCRHNSFVLTKEMAPVLADEGEIKGSGTCSCPEPISLSLSDDEDDCGSSLICDNYSYGNKISGIMDEIEKCRKEGKE